MRVESPQPYSPTFEYRHQLKTLFLKKKIKVPTGFYGGNLTEDTVTLEHLQPKSKGGKTDIANLVLATRRNNEKRGNLPLRDFLNTEFMEKYLSYFKDVKVDGFNGNEYIKLIRKTVRRLTGGKKNEMV